MRLEIAVCAFDFAGPASFAGVLDEFLFAGEPDPQPRCASDAPSRN
jgi:hypothetical protein